MADQLASGQQNRAIQEAGVTGLYDDEATQQAKALEQEIEGQKLSRDLQKAGVTGVYDDQDTLQKQALDQEMQGQALERALQRAGATGEFIEEGATGEPKETLESRLRTAQLTGALGDKATLEGRQADMDLIGAILASQDDAVKMSDVQKRDFGSALANMMTSMDSEQRGQLRSSLGGLGASRTEQEAFAANQRAAQEPILQSLGFTPEEMTMFFDRGMDVATIMGLRDQ